MTLTLIESIEAEIEKCKEWLIHEFGDHMSIHNSLTELRQGVLKSVSSVESTPLEEETSPPETPEESEPPQP